MHVHAKFRENTSIRFWVTVRKLNVTDRQTDKRTDGRTLQYLPSRAFGAAGDNYQNKTQSTGSAGVQENDMIPNFAIIGNCRLGNGQGHHSLEGPERGEIHAHSMSVL